METIEPRSAILVHGIFEPEFFMHLKSPAIKHIFVMEGRPDFSTAKQTATALEANGMKATLISDNMAGFLFKRNYLNAVYISSVSNQAGQDLCHVGSLILGVLGKFHNVPVVVRPSPAKHNIKIVGNPETILSFNGFRVAPEGIDTYVPLLEWVDQKYTSKGVSLAVN